jgi:hypothetical protein
MAGIPEYDDLPFIDCDRERTEFSDKFYGAFGRALYVAQHFESNCRALATLLDLKKTIASGALGSPDDPEFVKLVSGLWDRSLGSNIKVLETYGFPQDICSLLNKARQARNAIAHDITLGIEHKIEEDLGRNEILRDVEVEVKQIAEGDMITGFLIQYLTHEPYPLSDYLRDYPNKIVKWVCETFDSE